jgi:hypothetical protein
MAFSEPLSKLLDNGSERAISLLVVFEFLP